MAREARIKQAVTLLMGLQDPASPLSMVDVEIVRHIMRFRNAPVNVITEIGDKETRDPDSNELQSFDDQPAVVRVNGITAWYRDGKLHRNGDQPAVKYPGSWYRNGKKHREGYLLIGTATARNIAMAINQP